MLTVAPLHASVAVGAVKLGEAVHSMVALSPALPITGAVLSLIVMVWLRVTELLPQASTATHVRVLVPVHADPPVTSAPTITTVAPLQASDAVGAVNTEVPVHSTVALAPA
jgi:hypothetical protein